MKFLLAHSVSTKIAFVAVLSSLVLLGGSGFLLVRFQADLVADYNGFFRETINDVIETRAIQEHTALHKNMRQHSTILAQNMALPLYNINEEEARNTLIPFMAYPDVVAVKVLDDVGEEFAAAWHEGSDIVTGVNLPAHVALPELIINVDAVYRAERMGGIEVFYSDAKLREAIASIKHRSLISAEKFYDFNRERLEAATWVQTLSILAIVLALLVILGSVLFRLIRRPLCTVNAYLKQLATGHVDVDDIAYSGQDEIAELYKSAHRLKEGMQGTIEQANAVAAGDYEHQVKLLSKHDQLGKALGNMSAKLKDMHRANEDDDWHKAAQNSINEAMRGAQDVPSLSHNVLVALINQVEAQLGLVYFHPTDRIQHLTLSASYAVHEPPTEFAFGDGLVGEVAENRQTHIVSDIPADYLSIQTSAYTIEMKNLIIFPLIYENQIKGVIELGKIREFSRREQVFLNETANAIAIELYAAESRMRLAT